MNCTGKDMAMCSEESVVILLKQCRDLRRQDMLFRVATLLLLCFCTALAVLGSSSGFGRFKEQTLSKQEAIPDSRVRCSSSTNEKMHIHLNQDLNKTVTLPHYIQWTPAFNSSLTFENNSVMIPKPGGYFVYSRFTLHCPYASTSAHLFSLKVERWSESYPATTELITARSSLDCTTNDFQTVYVGELLDLQEGDQLKVNITAGYHLISKSNFGVFSQ